MRTLLAVLLVPAVAAGDAPTIALDDAAKTVADALAKADTTSATPGETLTIASIAAGDPSKPVDIKPVRDAIGKLRLKIIDDISTDDATVITVQAANGARARIAFGRGAGAIFMVAKPRATKPPGKCVAIPDVRHPVHVYSSGINQDGERGHGESFWGFKTERIHDVDGDGVTDAFVPVAKTKRACPEAVSFRVFVVRGTCGHDLGVIGPGSFQLDAGTAAIDASGFRPFVMTAEESKHGKRGIPEVTTTVRRFVVKRGKYTQADVKSTTGVCHHCATWHCYAPP